MMGTKRFKIKKIIILSIAILFIFILALFIWIILPGPEATLISLIPAESFAYASVKISLTDSGVSDLVNNLRLITNNPVVKIKERFLIKFIMPLFLPMDVATTFILNPDTKNPDYLVFVKNNRLTRLFRLSALLKIRLIKGHLYTIFKDVIIISRQSFLAKRGLNSYNKRVNKRVVFLSNEVDDFWRLRDTEDGVLIINNADANFSEFIKDLERKNAFIIFPTVNSIKWISGYLDIVNADKIKGSLIFKYKELTDVEATKGDIHFFSEIFHRFFRANGLNFIKEMMARSDSLDLNFEISGLRRLTVSLLSQKGEK
ncbi:MAG: hypothetical protein Q8N49_01145 [Candidatus Omnitrophota bacterium]|nr:hypothetical protein [Candidatus Omnitrophota bacterium]